LLLAVRAAPCAGLRLFDLYARQMLQERWLSQELDESLPLSLKMNMI